MHHARMRNESLVLNSHGIQKKRYSKEIEVALSICQCEVFLVIRIVISRWSADVLLTEGIRCLGKLAGINAFHYTL